MTNRTHTGILLPVLAARLTACDGADPRGPSAPSTLQPQQTPRPAGSGRDTYDVADVMLSGMVYEVTPMGRAPIEGVMFCWIPSMCSRRPTSYRLTWILQRQARVGLPVLMGALGGCGNHFDLCGERRLRDSGRATGLRFSPPSLPGCSPR